MDVMTADILHGTVSLDPKLTDWYCKPSVST
jgi:hypothetical protein